MSRWRRLAATAAGSATILGVWEGFVRWRRVPEYLLPAPSTILAKLAATLPTQAEHLGVTAATTLVGLALALAVGIALALLVLYLTPLRGPVLSFFAAFNGIPKVAVAPLLVTWLGLGTEPKVLLAFLMGLFPIFVNGLTGLSEIERDVLDLARLAGGNELRIFRKVRLPHALPYLTDALKVAFPLALVGSIVGEFIGGNRGIGFLILQGQFNLDIPLVFACLVSITVFTTVGTGVVVLAEGILLRWRPSRRP